MVLGVMTTNQQRTHRPANHATGHQPIRGSSDGSGQRASSAGLFQ